MFVAHQLGRYHLLDRIACGGMAEIFRAKTFDSQGGEHMVAIKRLLRHLAEDEAFLQMLVDEARIASLLVHDNIAQVYEFAHCDEDYFLAMEYVDGKDLRSIIDRCRADGRFVQQQHTLFIMERVLRALHAAHHTSDASGRPLNIVHRDVSPSNIIISYQGEVKLCDFGIAKATLSRVETRAGVVKGKVRYMSPEQTRGRQLDGRSDIFSAGSVLYELLTNQPAFQASSEMALVVRVRDAKYHRPSRHNSRIPRSLESVLRRSLSRTPAARYQNANVFADDLHELLVKIDPEYQQIKLGRFLRDLFAQDIDDDLRRLEEFVLGSTDPTNVGENLLADGTEYDVARTEFTPVARHAIVNGDTAVRTRILPTLPDRESRLPRDVSLHEAKTQIHGTNPRIIKGHKRARPKSAYLIDSMPKTIVTSEIDDDTDTTDTEDPGSHPSDFHRAPTKIIDPDSIED